MKYSFLVLLSVFVSLACCAQPAKSGISIIPEPVSVHPLPGKFTLTQATVIGSDAAGMANASWLAAKLATATGFKLAVKPGAAGKSSIQLLIKKQANAEQYHLSVNPTGVVITAGGEAGLFYGLQTLLQLLPAEIESNKKVVGIQWTMPAVEIEDYPRFAWRGLMFDVSRHFFGMKDVREFIDEMARYKYNLLHLHLTVDEGWRIEIKSYPKLTSVGAWNVKKTGTFGTFTPPADDEPRDYGGFFTQDDIRELVAYAKSRYINILPEIDVPGHSMAAVAAYPELSCTPGTYRVNSGEKFMEWPPSGHFYGLVDNTLCPANEQVYTFLDKVMGEIAALFPFEYIHMGGDETARNFWEKSDQIKALMQKENLKDLNEVQSYFVKRVEKIVESKGKKLIGWDEILEGGLAPNAAVMSWRGVKGGIEASKMGHEVVMSPTTFAYLDYMQGDAALEPPVYATLRLKTAYSFDPLPPGVEAKYVKGGQANLWTEQVYNMRHLQYMVWPRAFAIAEAVWSPAANKNWNNFAAKVEQHFNRYNAAGIKYAPSMYEPLIKISRDTNGGLLVNFENEIDGLDVYYSFDNSFPDNFYPRYENKPVTVPKDAAAMKVVTYRNGKPLGRLITITMADMQKRAK
ncbi:MAG: family 20 glycosylhydrolase [Bacteroidota bacterium]|nr:family 20 glycosylhydrolase [Bacteroidota bacterium]